MVGPAPTFEQLSAPPVGELLLSGRTRRARILPLYSRLGRACMRVSGDRYRCRFQQTFEMRRRRAKAVSITLLLTPDSFFWVIPRRLRFLLR